MEIVLRVVQPAEDVALNPAGIKSLRDRCAEGWFEALFQAHYSRVVGMLARLVGDRGQAEEIAADAFCKLARQRVDGNLDGVTAWVYRVAINAGLDGVRSNVRRKRREEAAGAGNPVAREAEALNQLLQRERCARVQEVLAGLKPRDAQLLLLRAGGMAYRELAQTLGINAASIGTLLARAEAEFEKKYRARYGDDV